MLHDYWLISQLVNRTVNGTHLSRVFITVEYHFIGNRDTRFNIHLYETSSPDITSARDVSNYQLEYRDNSNLGDSDHLTVAIDFITSHSSFYFSIESVPCLILNRVMVFYRICPPQVHNMTIYPETIVSRGTIRLIIAACIENAEPENGSFPILGCSPNGTWNVVSGQCRCRPGAVSALGGCMITGELNLLILIPLQ